MIRNGQGYKKESFKTAMSQAKKMQEYCEIKVIKLLCMLTSVVFSFSLSRLLSVFENGV